MITERAGLLHRRGASTAHHVRWLGAALGYAGLSLLLCLPLARQLSTHVPLGELGDPTVPYFNLWTLIWNAERLVNGYAGYWEAPIFYPAHDTFALSEPQGLTGLAFAPLLWLTGPVAAYNLTLLGLLTLNGLAGRRLLSVMGASARGASWGGALFVGLQFFHEELGVLQLCATWPLVLGLSEIALLTRRHDPWAVLRLAMWTVATAWSCIYFVLFFGLSVALSLPFLLRRGFLDRRMWLAGLCALGLVSAGLLPLMTAEQRAVAHHSRSASSIHLGSASALTYLQFPKDTPLSHALPAWTRPAGRRSLYPGASLCALAALGVVRYRQRQRRWLAYSGAALALCLLLSFGTRLHVGSFTPYALTAQRYLPGFDRLRSPYRAAALVQVLLAAWAGLGVDALIRRLMRRGQARAAHGVAALVVLLAVLEVTPWHFARARFPSEALAEPWIAWLATQPKGAVAMLPPNKSGRAADYTETVVYMLQALRHGHPIINGYSGFFPPDSAAMIAALRTFPKRRALRALEVAHIPYAVVDAQHAAVQQLKEQPNPRLTPLFTSGPRVVYRVR